MLTYRRRRIELKMQELREMEKKRRRIEEGRKEWEVGKEWKGKWKRVGSEMSKEEEDIEWKMKE